MVETTLNILNNDTIAAIATATASGGIGIIRISGEKAFEIASKFFEGKKKFEDIPINYLAYGSIKYENVFYDEVMAVKMKAPHSFTCEDVVEFQCHGGQVVLSNILSLICANGARLAEPGEFTKRAFVNGRIDLSQAEAVIDLINSKTENSSKIAAQQLNGNLSSKINYAKKELVSLIAQIEANADYPEYDIEEITNTAMLDGLTNAKKSLEQLQNGYSKGRILRDGINIAITGKPNVGKSSLLNKLAGHTKAIVTNIPGTTRDIVEEYINVGGVPVRIIDTAGIRETEDAVEKIGVEVAKKEVENADIVIFMIDAFEGYDSTDKEIFEQIICPNKIVLINKIDLNDKQINLDLKCDKIINISVKESFGIDALEKQIVDLFANVVNKGDDVVISNARHKGLIDSSVASINEALDSLNMGMPTDCISVFVQDAANALAQITGENINEDVINEIFSRFCIGK